ncbi:hypothetical protein [Bdellovibrio sp. HCB-110]|uniref:hypothetical protein n=1 Tax=Bdellovibrio sp. HCB-110 TaxID=3391182 RepID=UPI0039B5CF26
MENSCCSCFSAKAPLECGICKSAVCKKCAQFLEEDSFSFLAKIPQDLSFNVYCPQCFDAKVAPELDSYNDTMERAKSIMVFFKDQGKESRLMSRKEPPVQVVDCADREETLLRLAFFAAKANYNGLVDAELTSKKIREGSYQTHKWSGTAIPTHIDPKKVNR